MDDAIAYELVDGQLVERNVSLDSSESAANVHAAIGPFVRQRRLGRIFDSELGIRIHPSDPNHTRRADVAFIARERAPRTDASFLRIPPDLVVEVVSPSDGAAELQAKVQEWLRHGVRLVWVVYPEAGAVHVYPREGRPQILQRDDEVDGGDVLPGFRCPVASFLPLSLDEPAEASAPAAATTTPGGGPQ
jgi:Uma2 family endonuclease